MAKDLEDTQKSDLTSGAGTATTVTNQESLSPCILIEGPRFGDVEYYARWFSQVAEANRYLQTARKDAFFRHTMNSLEVLHLFDLGLTATLLLSQFANKAFRAFVLDANSEDVNEFCVMARIGFFRLTEGRYQMSIPKRLGLSEVKQALSDLAATEDDDWIHPEKLLAIMTYATARDWQRRLNEMDEDLRLANRDLLLAEANGRPLDPGVRARGA
jgi:hypothetical protein